jgi:two-component system, OmpR family, sensor kinase
MSTIRSRLTTAYSLALLGTLAAFALALWGLRSASTRRELAEELTALADSVANDIDAARRAGDSLTVRPEFGPELPPDPVIDPVATAQLPVATARLRTLIEGIPGYVWVLDATGRALYQSWAVRRLPVPERGDLQVCVRSLPVGGVYRIDLPRPAGAVLCPDSLLGSRQDADRPSQEIAAYLTVRDLRVEADSSRDGRARADSSEYTDEIARLVVGASARPTIVAPREVIAAVLLVAPLILLLSIGAAYLIAGPAIRTNLDKIINEVEAITDGRSLHRRLPVDATADELARLTATLNAMMGRLETSFGALRRFTADASHELKTPLAVLRANVERAMSAPAGTTEQMVALEEALQEVARMADLVDGLLTLARADEGRFDLHRQPVELEPLVREVFETAVILGEEAGLDVDMPIVEAAATMGDRTRLRQLFLNLVTNAIKYTPRGGSVSVSLARRDGTAAFTVRDTGVGIAAADLPHIFERFYRADRVRSRLAERGGFGLGLSISQWIVQAHGGHLTVSSRLGRGSTFTVTLPVFEPDPTTAERTADEEAEPTVK